MPRPAPSSRLSARLWRWLRRDTGPGGGAGSPAGSCSEDPLLQAGRLIRQQREARGLNLRELALETRISTPVLEALERGWRDRLPEGTYLRTMLPLIEQHLELPAGSLGAALPPDPPGGGGNGQQRGRRLLRFTPGSIDVFTTWQGTLLYGAITLGLIYGVNLQQQRLAAANLLSVRPIAPLSPSEQLRTPDAGSTLLKAYPDLRPLQRAGGGVALSTLQRVEASAAARSQGALALQLSQPSRVRLRSDSGQRSDLQGASGELVLQLQAPLQLEIEPAPAGGAVSWNGEPLAPLPQQPGRFQLPQAPRAAGSAGTPPGSGQPEDPAQRP
ncbi:helix-turn-helix domain-containing protein [Vulcanococcus limneticus]|uniref:helix-turn-helix domain-containing protein n=1 Tax=Vulcanococcus limneticus TaxID=2170428 RepID=UPI000B9966AD|nr:helix-turn-helix transcriptional regulator [Vulcanococcus limneticus]MCP9790687.1 helix-turn-helix domain-containing protein [Vulcanococcus limneticus MW73D5]MCP9892971.1 helix-turn-helix domain-containing protein [Vulcanococcus limneticus Candia 3F8]MCP9896294.1 helix-turn-helix domain-containing protein [Vulcanococcus limneticus Candia 3B3]